MRSIPAAASTVSGCEVNRSTACPRRRASVAIAAPVRPVKMLVMHRTRSIGVCVLPAVTSSFMNLLYGAARLAGLESLTRERQSRPPRTDRVRPPLDPFAKKPGWPQVGQVCKTLLQKALGT